VSVGRLDALIWTLIYGGLVVLVVGFALLHRAAPGLAAAAIAAGGVLAAAGVVLVVVRSRTVGRKP